jgi:tetratricopeptide (TPR) repeat protein
MSRFTDWLKDRHRGAVLLLVGLVLGLYLPYSGNPFFFDDLPFFSSQPTVEPWLDVLQRPRGLPYNTLQLTWHWFGNNLSHAYRLVDALLHTANAIALFYLLNSLSGLQLAQRSRAELAWASLFASLVFALSPVATYAAGYVIQRSILMATLFSLLALLAWVKAWTSGRVGPGLLALAFYFLSCFSKEHAVALPALLAAISLLLARHRRLSWTAIAACGTIALGIAVFLMLRRSDVVGVSYEPMSAHLFRQLGVQATGWVLHLLSIATQAGLFFRYLLLWLLPVPAWMAIDMRAEFLATLGDWRVLAGLLAYAGCGVVALRLLLKPGLAGLIGLALLAPWLLFAVEFATVRVQETFVLYRSYLWIPLLMLLPAMLALRLQDLFHGRRQVVARWLMPLLLLLCLIPAASNRLAVAADPWTLWDDAARLLEDDAVPGADRILYNRGRAALAAGQHANAVADMERVVRISPDFWQVWQLLGAAHLANGQPQQAYQDFGRALQLRPNDGALLYARAIAAHRAGQLAQARVDLQSSCQASWMSACLILARLQAEQSARRIK